MAPAKGDECEKPVEEPEGGSTMPEITVQAEAQEEPKQEEQGKSAEEELKQKITALEQRVKALEEENSSLKDQYLRKQADFENFRKRMQKEKQDIIQYGTSELLLDLITIIDDFERAIKSSEGSKDFDSFYNGIVLIEQQFTGLLERKWGLVRFESKGEEFDPQKHEAIMMEESAEFPVSTVLEDLQKGYKLYDRILRPSKVKVSKPVANGSEKKEPEGSLGEENGSV